MGHLGPLFNAEHYRELEVEQPVGPVMVKGVIDLLSMTKPPIIVDYKSGKKYESHARQVELYMALALTERKLKEIEGALYYLDFKPGTWERLPVMQPPQAKIVLKEWEGRIAKIKKDKLFPPRPGRYCNWCGYSRYKGGPCQVG
jgi:CRISPR/Cas system-associated exonuclease Cas4 (RecB family)